jgi:hypothetical protein
MRGPGRLVVALALTTAIYIPTVAQQTAQATCGVWRWPVKTLSDPARTKVDYQPDLRARQTAPSQSPPRHNDRLEHPTRISDGVPCVDREG